MFDWKKMLLYVFDVKVFALIGGYLGYTFGPKYLPSAWGKSKIVGGITGATAGIALSKIISKAITPAQPVSQSTLTPQQINALTTNAQDTQSVVQTPIAALPAAVGDLDDYDGLDGYGHKKKKHLGYNARAIKEVEDELDLVFK
jgi:hypothetical protein